MLDKFLIFDIWGDYAHFNRYYTTSSPLTFSIPPRTALIGLISAIIGKSKEEYLQIMTKEKAEIAVRLINGIKKIRITQNLIDTKGNHWRPVKRGNLTGRTQIRFEYLKDPRFRIYFRSNTEVYNCLKMNLESHKSVYTPCLGISELIADFIFISESSVAEEYNNEMTGIHTVIPLDTIITTEELLQPGYKYFKERIPVEMLPGRIVTEYREVLYEVKGKPIKAKVKNALKLSNGDVITLL